MNNGGCHVDLHWRAELLWLEGLSFFWAGGCIATSLLEPDLEWVSLSAPAVGLTTVDPIAWMEHLDKIVFTAALLLGLWFLPVASVLSLAPLLWPHFSHFSWRILFCLGELTLQPWG